MDSNINKISLLDFFIILAEKKFLFIVVMLIFFGCGILVTLSMPQQYMAQAVIMKSSQSGSSSLSSLLGNDGAVSGLLKSMDKMGGDNSDVVCSILASRRLSEKVINHFNLVHYYGFDKRKSYFFEDVLKKYQKVLRVTENKFNNIEVSVVDTNPVMSADITNYTLDQLSSIISELSIANAKNSRSFYSERLAIIKSDLDSATKAFTQFKTQNNYLDIDQQIKSTVESIANLDASKIAAEIEMEKIKSQFGSSDARLFELQKNHAVIEKQIQRYMEAGGGDVLIPLNRIPQTSARYAELLRNVKIQEALYEFVLRMDEQAKFTETNTTPQIQILERAQIPQKRISPKRSIIVLCFLMFGFIATSLSLLLWKWYKIQKLNQTETFRRLVHLFSLLANKK